jgi:hypothetical protein
MKNRLTPEEFVKLAREVPRDERAPYAFEKRVMARIAGAHAADPLAFWTRALWRAVTPCLAVMAIAAFVSFSRTDDVQGDAGLDLEAAVMAAPEVAFDPSV